MKVLIIDRSMQIIRRLEELLLADKTATTVISADHYENGLQIFNENRPDVVLLGISSPENESIALLRELTAGIHKAPVIMLFINMNEHIQRQCMMLGANQLLDKYYDFEKIPGAISGIAGVKSMCS